MKTHNFAMVRTFGTADIEEGTVEQIVLQFLSGVEGEFVNIFPDTNGFMFSLIKSPKGVVKVEQLNLSGNMRVIAEVTRADITLNKITLDAPSFALIAEIIQALSKVMQ